MRLVLFCLMWLWRVCVDDLCILFVYDVVLCLGGGGAVSK